MGRCIIRESPDSDFYVVWSNSVDAPVWYGDRHELLTEYKPEPEAVEDADKYGTSAVGYGPKPPLAYDDEGPHILQDFERGKFVHITRTNIFELARRYRRLRIREKYPKTSDITTEIPPEDIQ